jgi:hypothetical protein
MRYDPREVTLQKAPLQADSGLQIEYNITRGN